MLLKPLRDEEEAKLLQALVKGKSNSFSLLIQEIQKALSSQSSTENIERCTVLHVQAEWLWLWADVDEVAAYLANEDNVKKLVQHLTDAVLLVGMLCSDFQAQHLAQLPPATMVWPCLSCNTPLDAGHHHHEGMAPSRDAGRLWGKLHHVVHHATLLMGLTRALLTGPLPDPRMAAAQDAMADAMARPPPCAMDQVTQYQTSCMMSGVKPEGLLLPTLVGVVDNCVTMAPKAAHLAASLLSLLMARRPAATLSILDPEPLAETLVKYLQSLLVKLTPPPCIVEVWFALADILNVLPLLYHLGDWAGAAAYLAKTNAPALLAALAMTLMCLATDECSAQRYCRPVDYEEYPEASNLVIALADLYEAGGQGAVEALRGQPVGFVAVALVEVLGRWQWRGVQCVSARLSAEPSDEQRKKMTKKEIREYTESVAQGMTHYLPRWRQLVADVPSLQYILPIVEALASGIVSGAGRTKLPDKEQGLLRRPLHTVSMRCALPSCGANERVGGGDLLQCSGGCKGLARYCCAEHQREHWAAHKAFCKRAAAEDPKKKRKEEGKQQQ